jgi:hypothetical protein
LLHRRRGRRRFQKSLVVFFSRLGGGVWCVWCCVWVVCSIRNKI